MAIVRRIESDHDPLVGTFQLEEDISNSSTPAYPIAIKLSNNRKSVRWKLRKYPSDLPHIEDMLEWLREIVG